MRKRATVAAIALFSCILGVAQNGVSAPQTARQALIEMFFSKKPGTFMRHLPTVTKAALEKSGAMSTFEQYSVMISQAQTQQGNFQTFETGPVLLAAEDPKTGQKFEVTVVNDAPNGERDDIDLSFRTYKNGEAQRTPFMPKMTFTMKKEAQLWTLNEISITVHLPLADPDLLKALTEKAQPQAPQSSAVIPIASHPDTPAQSAGSDVTVLSAMHMILDAEATYASRYPHTGYTCTLSNLDGFGGGGPNEHQAMLINSGLASGKKYGFVFVISDCGGAPATRFMLTATPNAANFGRKAFCADQSGTIRSAEDGSAATCLATGTPAQ